MSGEYCLCTYGSLDGAQLIKIHLRSGKLSLMTYEDFDESPTPLMARRVKINIRKLDYEVFEYGGPQYPKHPLYRKSRYLTEDYPRYADQFAFDEALEATGLLGEAAFGPTLPELTTTLGRYRRHFSSG